MLSQTLRKHCFERMLSHLRSCQFSKIGRPSELEFSIRQHIATLFARSRSSAKMSSSRPSASAFENARREAE
jgi:hypothetical protein